MAYETPKNAARETFVEPTAARQLHRGSVPTTWTQINAPINCDRGGILVSSVTGTVILSTDGSTVLCALASDCYLPLSFPVYIKSPGRTTAEITLINYTLGGATVKE